MGIRWTSTSLTCIPRGFSPVSPITNAQKSWVVPELGTTGPKVAMRLPCCGLEGLAGYAAR